MLSLILLDVEEGVKRVPWREAVVVYAQAALVLLCGAALYVGMALIEGGR